MAPPKTAAKLSIAVQTFERMRDEIAEMGARTPHELMRSVEVSFIRDCAEMAARSSLTRTESRWGLYHERADLPERDDQEWGYHLNLRKASDGSMEFLKRPVAPYFVPVPEFDTLPPTDRTVWPVEQPPLVGGRAPVAAQSRVSAATPADPPSPRIVAVLAIEEPTVAALAEFLRDTDAGVRRTAVSTLTEHTPDDYATELLGALHDDDATVRRVAADGVRELVEVLPDPRAARQYLASPDPVVRSVSVYLLAARRVGDADVFRHALGDVDHRVRIEAVRALVSIDDADGAAAAIGDRNREVRIAVANGLGTLGAGHGAISELVADNDPLVRAAALAALGQLGCHEADFAAVEQALRAPAWQVREGAARALSGSAAEHAVPRLLQALVDEHLDVRKAAVLSLSRWAVADGAARDALSVALKDDDADVRAYARRALHRNRVGAA